MICVRLASFRHQFEEIGAKVIQMVNDQDVKYQSINQEFLKWPK